MRHIGPPSDQPYMAARSEPAASITARTSPIRSSIVCSATRSESPCPRLSKTITLAKALSLFRRCSWLGTSHSNSTCERVPGISTMSRGPWPKMRYAMETSPLRAYLTGLSISAPLRKISGNPSWLLSASLPQFVPANVQKVAAYTIIARLKLQEGRLITCRFDRISICLRWVKSGNTHDEQRFSAIPPKADHASDVQLHIGGILGFRVRCFASPRNDESMLRGACHRARVRATRWLAMTLPLKRTL